MDRKPLFESFQEQAATHQRIRYGSAEAIKQLEQGYVILRAAMDSSFREQVLAQESFDDQIRRRLATADFKPLLKEYLRSSDAKVLFPKVLLDQIQEPREPMYVGLNVIAKRMTIEGPGNTVEWITTDAVRARWVDEGEAPGRDNLGFARHMDTIKIRKAMAESGFTEEMIADSQYPIIELHVNAIGRAINRLIEEHIWATAQAKAVTVFDNGGGDSIKGVTTGIGADGTANSTMSVHDYLDLFAIPVVHGYSATQLIAHPLQTLSMLKDEVLRSLLRFQWPAGQAQPEIGERAYQAKFPYQITAHMVPYVPSNAKTKASNAAFAASIFVCDPNESLVWIEREGMRMKDWENPEIDVLHINVRYRGGCGVLHNGLGMAQAKGISTAANYGPAIPIIDIAA